MQGVLSAKVVLVMYGDYQCSRSADVYKMIKAIKRELSACFEKIIYALSSVIPQAQIHPHAQRQPKQPLPPPLKDSFGQCTILYCPSTKLENYLVEYANDLGLIPQFLKDLSKQVHVDRINEDIESGCRVDNDCSSPIYQ